MPTDAPKMLTNCELWAAANHYVAQYGEDAGIVAAARCDELLDAQDYDGVRNCQAVLERIDQFLETQNGTPH